MQLVLIQRGQGQGVGGGGEGGVRESLEFH